MSCLHERTVVDDASTEGEGTNKQTRVENTYLIHFVKRSIEIILTFE